MKCCCWVYELGDGMAGQHVCLYGVDGTASYGYGVVV